MVYVITGKNIDIYLLVYIIHSSGMNVYFYWIYSFNLDLYSMVISGPLEQNFYKDKTETLEEPTSMSYKDLQALRMSNRNSHLPMLTVCIFSVC